MDSVEKSEWILECPCKNSNLEIPYGEELNLSSMNVKEDIPGKFYYDKQGDIFGRLFFKKREGYDGPLVLSSPIKLYLEITSKCNLSCRHCYNPKKGVKEMDKKSLAGIIDEFSSLGGVGVQLLGGEPTLFSDFPWLIDLLQEKKLKTEIVSNGYSLSPELLEQIKGKINSFTISIDGSEENHNLIRGNPNSYRNARASLKKLVDSGFPADSIMTVNKLNYQDIESLNETFGSIAPFSVKMMSIPTHRKHLEEISLSREEIDIVKETCFALGIPTQSFKVSFKEKGKYSFFGCPGGKIDAVVDVDGELFRCLYYRDVSIGNVFLESLKEVWDRNNKELVEEESNKCKECGFRGRCGGFCRA